MGALADLLAAAVASEASDVHLKVGAPPHVRIAGKLSRLELPALTRADTDALALEALPAHRIDDFERTGEADFALSLPGLGRFRVNVHRQRGSAGIVIRRVLPGIPRLDDLGLPPGVAGLIDHANGLVLVTGPAGGGKTTTLAAMVDRLNSSRACSIVTIEDPVEVLHTDKLGIVCQREIGTDTPSYESALAHVWRQDPDVIAIGSLRDAEAVMAALTLAETGRLVLATLPTNGATETVNRVLELFPSSREQQVRATLARVLRGVVSQRLLERRDGDGRVPVVELLVCTERVAERIAESDGATGLDDLIAEGDLYGMVRFDESLFALCASGTIDVREAVAAANDPRDLKFSLEAAGIAPRT